MAEPDEPSDTEQAIAAWAMARFAFHLAGPDSLERLGAQARSDAEERTLAVLELGGDETAATFLRGLTDADEAIRQTAPGYR